MPRRRYSRIAQEQRFVPVSTERYNKFSRVLRLKGKCCAYCGHEYTDYADIKKHNPLKGYGDDNVCSGCWTAYSLSKRKIGWWIKTE